MKIKPNQYLYPPRSSSAIPPSETAIFGELGWIAQLKYNDSHALIKYTSTGDIELWNRHGEKFRTYHCPDHLKAELQHIGELLGVEKTKTTILDGGLLDQKHKHIKDVIVLWDILALNDEHLLGTTYTERHKQLSELTNGPWFCSVPNAELNFGRIITENTFVPVSYTSEHWDDLWDIVNTANESFTNCGPLLEGLVFKDPAGILEMGYKENNNSSWIVRSRVHTARHRF